MMTLTHISLTGTSQTFDFLLLTISWLFVRAHIKMNEEPVTSTTKHIYRYFGYFALFNFFMAAPNLALIIHPSLFPALMAWGYVIGNVFLLISLAHISLMTVNLVPRFTDKEMLIRRLWGGLVILMTALNAVVIGIQHQPNYDSVSRVTHFVIPSWMGASLGIISFLAYLPAIVVLIFSFIRQHREQRIRSGLLVLGFVIIMIVGPLHAVASNWRIFLTADILNIVSLVFLTTGVLYRIKQQTQSAPKQSTPSAAPPSNTV